MKIKQHIQGTMLFFGSLLMLVSCQTEMNLEESPLPSSKEETIRILGGAPSGMGLVSRAVNKPDKEGYCNADRLGIWFFRGLGTTALTYSHPSFSDLKEYKGKDEIEVERYSAESTRDKVATHTFTANANGNQNTGYGIAALAFSEEDRGKFSVDDTKTDLSFTNLTLTLNGTITPEVYFGRLRFKRDGEKNAPTADLTELPYTLTNQTYNNCVLTGDLYRIVSQLNISITGLEEMPIDKIEMYVSNLPDQLPLYGSHGAWYPVGAASHHLPDKEETRILVAEVSDISQDCIALSTFLLPSREGREIWLRICYKGKIVDKDGKEFSEKTYPLRPAKSVFLTGDDAEVYRDDASDSQKYGPAKKEDLYVYNASSNLFYSYANVRVNIKGSFENICAEESDADLQIEVCPSFEDTHSFTIN